MTRSTVDRTIDVTRYVILAFPLVMSVFLFAGTLLVGVTSYVTDDKDREWWARSGGTCSPWRSHGPSRPAIVLYATNVLTFAYSQILTALGAVGTGLAAARLGGSAGTSSGRHDDLTGFPRLFSRRPGSRTSRRGWCCPSSWCCWR